MTYWLFSEILTLRIQLLAVNSSQNLNLSNMVGIPINIFNYFIKHKNLISIPIYIQIIGIMSMI